MCVKTLIIFLSIKFFLTSFTHDSLSYLQDTIRFVSKNGSEMYFRDTTYYFRNRPLAALAFLTWVLISKLEPITPASTINTYADSYEESPAELYNYECLAKQGKDSQVIIIYLKVKVK